MPPGRRKQIGDVLVQHIEPGAEHPLLKKALQLLIAAELGGLLRLPDAAGLFEYQQRVLKVVQQGGGLGVADAEVLVQRLGQQPRA